MKKEVLIITNYFPPETGAAANRIFHLAQGLNRKNFNVSVLTPLPNYPTGSIFPEFRGQFRANSIEDNIKIRRLWIYASNSKNKLLRLFAMLSYSISLVWYLLWNKIPKTIIIQSPPLLVAFTSVLFSRSKKRKIILNVSDLWPLAGLELGALNKGPSYSILEKIERFNYINANVILGQSNEILNHVTSICPDKETLLYRNFPDFEPPDIIEVNKEKKIKIVYAGLLGIAQGIYKLIKELDYTNAELHIYGSGSEQGLISSYLEENHELPIVYHGQLPRHELHKVLPNYDLAIIPLLNRIYGSVPSKIFEYAKLGLPMLYFGGGEGEIIIEKYNLGWIAKAGDYGSLNRTLSQIDKEGLTLNLKKEIQKTAIEHFSFEPQIDNLLRRF